MIVNKRKAEAIDFHVGERIKQRRRYLGLSQKELAASLDISYQQFQKYERAQNRLSAGKVFKISQILGVPVGWLFEGLPGTEMTTNMADNIDETFPRLSDIRNKEIEQTIKGLIDAIAEQSKS